MSKVAFFDFDGTLAHRDSLFPFLCYVAGTPQCVGAFICAFVLSLFKAEAGAKRTFIKTRVLSSLLAGKRIDDIAQAAARMKDWPRWIAPSVEALRHHHAQGHKVVIATGSLDLYIHQMIGDLPVDDVLCTCMQVSEGILTGQMEGGNCVRALKAERVKAYMQAHGPFDESWAYGNAPHDLLMMEYTTHRVIV